MAVDVERAESAVHEERPGFFARLHGEWLEILATALLALATVASAWSAYQASRWRSRETMLLSASNSARVHADEADDLADTELTIDVTMFLDYLKALDAGDRETELRYEEGLFREEMKAAVEAWKTASMERSPTAPATPFELPEYRNANRERAQELEREADARREEARRALENSDRYVLLTVLFAAVLFFAGLCSKFKVPGARVGVLVMGYVLFLASMVFLALRPVA